MRRQEVFKELCKQCFGYTPEVALCCRPGSEIPACGKCALRTDSGCFCLQEATEAELNAEECLNFRRKFHKSKPSILKEDN